jgi:hypothetical protein
MGGADNALLPRPGLAPALKGECTGSSIILENFQTTSTLGGTGQRQFLLYKFFYVCPLESTRVQ